MNQLLLDYFGKDAASLRGKKLWLFDMDGTIYTENRLYDGTAELLRTIRQAGGRYVFITNNSSRSLADYVRKLRAFDLPVEEEDFFTSSQAAVLLLKQRCPGRKVYCQGTKSLIREFRLSGIDVTEAAERVDVVVVGFDTELTMDKLRTTCEILTTQTVDFYATNPDLVCPVSFGYIPDCGSICAMIRNATGKTPVYIGKPEPLMIQTVEEKFGVSPEDTVVVGDRLYTDIAAGLNAGVDAVCVLTGEATVEDIRTGEFQPTFVFESIKDLIFS